MNISEVYIFGNSDLKEDSMPLRILPQLREMFPQIDFQFKDPNEDFELPDNAVIIDTVAGLKEPAIFESLEQFESPPRLTLHDFDLYSHLQLLKKLGKLPKKLRIIGLPPEINKDKAFIFINDCLHKSQTLP